MSKKDDLEKLLKELEEDPRSYLINEPRYLKRHGALTGALLGAGVGAVIPSKNRILGALIGAGIGGLGMYNSIATRNAWQDEMQQKLKKAIDLQKAIEKEKLACYLGKQARLKRF